MFKQIFIRKLALNIIFFVLYAVFIQVKVLALDVLWFGNSYSHQGTTDVFKGLYQSNSSLQSSSPLYLETYFPGGWTIYDHMNSAADVNALKSRTWDYIVIQDQSQTPAYSYLSYAKYVKGGGTLSYDQFNTNPSTSPYAYYPANWQAKKDLLTLATSGNSTTKVIVFETWARDYLNSGVAGVLNWIDPTSSTMSQKADTMLRYNRLEAEAYEALNPGRIDIARVGEAFDYASDQIASNSMLYSDGSHASNFGYYLAGSEIFETITGVSSVGNSYDFSYLNDKGEKIDRISASERLLAQTLATNFNSIPEPSLLWYLGICGIFFVARYTFKNRLA